MDHPFFSVVIPVYNTVHELERCVGSITEQTFRDFEIVLVDDGSRDGSGELCDALSQKDNRIKVIHKENGGAAAARNTGICAATGEYLMFVDSDDMWDDPHAMEKLSRILEEQPDSDIICFGVKIYKEDGSLVKVRKTELPENCGGGKYEILKELVYRNYFFSACYNRVYSRKFLLDNELLFIPGMLCEDIEWVARVMVHCAHPQVYSGQFYKRIQRSEGSQTSSIGEKNVRAILLSIEKGVQYAREHCENEELLALYLEYWAYQYAMLLGFVPKMKDALDYKDVIKRLQALKYLLQYDHVKKVKMVRRVVSLLGVQGACTVLAAYYRFGRKLRSRNA